MSISIKTADQNVGAKPLKPDTLNHKNTIDQAAHSTTRNIPTPDPKNSASLSSIMSEATDGDSEEAIRLAGSNAKKSKELTGHNQALEEHLDNDNTESLAVAKTSNKKDTEKRTFSVDSHLNKLRQSAQKRAVSGEATQSDSGQQAGNVASVKKTEEVSATRDKTTTGTKATSAQKNPRLRTHSFNPAEVRSHMATDSFSRLTTILDKPVHERMTGKDAYLFEKQYAITN